MPSANREPCRFLLCKNALMRHRTEVERRNLAEQELEIIQGVIGAVVYQNYENGYSVLRLRVSGDQSVTVVGTIPLPAVGERLLVTGKWASRSRNSASNCRP